MNRSIQYWLVLVVFGVILLTATASRTPSKLTPADLDAMVATDIQDAVAELDSELVRRWKSAEVQPATAANNLTILRRLSLALHGTLPSIEEIRLFEADGRPDRLQHWTAAMLEDVRFSDYFAERLARGFVGVDQGQFLVFRRDRFSDWLQRQLRDHVPYDAIVRQMIQGEGVWTGKGEVNFLTSSYSNDEFDENILTARTTRAFLGQRIDCAQCHNHPFDDWTQAQFEGLTAHFGQVRLSLAGVSDDPEKDYKVLDSETLEDRIVEPAVPFNPEWSGNTGTRREQLARWVTHPENRRFERAIANRVWAFMFGRPYSDRPVDDLPNPEADDSLVALDILGKDFREHNYDLRRMVQVIAASSAFRMESSHPLDLQVEELQIQDFSVGSQEIESLSRQLEETRQNWAVFPLIRLRPEQVIGAMLQSNKVHTIDQNSHVITRTMRYFRERDFVDAFGDFGVDELQEHAGTIPQALLRMNGQFARELTELSPLSAPGRIMAVSSTLQMLVENSYLACLTRRPSQPELDYFVNLLNETNDKESVVQDLFWTLFNSPEFSWNH